MRRVTTKIGLGLSIYIPPLPNVPLLVMNASISYRVKACVKFVLFDEIWPGWEGKHGWKI